MAEARDDGLSAREASIRVLVRQLRDQTAETRGVGEMRAKGVSNPSFLCLSLAEKKEEALVLGGSWVGGGERKTSGFSLAGGDSNPKVANRVGGGGSYCGGGGVNGGGEGWGRSPVG